MSLNEPHRYRQVHIISLYEQLLQYIKYSMRLVNIENYGNQIFEKFSIILIKDSQQSCNWAGRGVE